MVVSELQSGTWTRVTRRLLSLDFSSNYFASACWWALSLLSKPSCGAIVGATTFGGRAMDVGVRRHGAAQLQTFPVPSLAATPVPCWGCCDTHGRFWRVPTALVSG